MVRRVGDDDESIIGMQLAATIGHDDLTIADDARHQRAIRHGQGAERLADRRRVLGQGGIDDVHTVDRQGRQQRLLERSVLLDQRRDGARRGKALLHTEGAKDRLVVGVVHQRQRARDAVHALHDLASDEVVLVVGCQSQYDVGLTNPRLFQDVHIGAVSHHHRGAGLTGQAAAVGFIAVDDRDVMALLHQLPRQKVHRLAAAHYDDAHEIRSLPTPRASRKTLADVTPASPPRHLRPLTALDGTVLPSAQECTTWRPASHAAHAFCERRRQRRGAPASARVA